MTVQAQAGGRHGDCDPRRSDSKRRRSANRRRAVGARRRSVVRVRIPADCPAENGFSTETPGPWNWRQESEARRRLADDCSTWNPRRCCPTGTGRRASALGVRNTASAGQIVCHSGHLLRSGRSGDREPRTTSLLYNPSLSPTTTPDLPGVRRATVLNSTSPVRIGSNAAVPGSTKARRSVH
jgi:hypothetical protein